MTVLAYRRLMHRQTAHCLVVMARAVAPRRSLSVSEWADNHRYLSGKQAGERGRWRTSRTPFLREVMDCLSLSARVSDIVVMKSSQVGVTEATVNWLGYILDHAPGPSMVMMPTLEARDAWKAQKLNPLFTETPVIRDLLGGVRSRDAANRQDMVDFPGGVLFLAGGNSPNSYAQRSVRNLILDDLDRFPVEIGEEGDVLTLARGRTKAFARAKRLFISTPTVKDESLIEREWLRSDRRRYHVPCPHCGEFQPLEWGGPELGYGIKWNATLTEAWYLCRACAAEIYEHQKPAMLAAGRWIPEDPASPIRGYHLTALMAPVGLGPSWLQLAQEWQHAVKSPGTLRAFLNTHLGECWEERGDHVEPVGLLARLEDYPERLPVYVRTGGVDVQKDRLELTVVDWGEGEEAWMRDHLILPGDTAQPDVWADLAAALDEFSPEALAVDSGYNASHVYAFVEKRRYAFATKGMPGTGRPLVEDERARRQRLRRQRRKGITVHLVGVDAAKALLYSRLKIREPGPGYVHFPRAPAFDDEYFAQLTAEKLVTKMRGTRPYVEWVQTRARNETLDCAVLALAALRLAGVSPDQRAQAARVPKDAKPPPLMRPRSKWVSKW
ncbi:MAG TPA: terminase gpA endonuclease subunit [Burkholderiales bacterium]|nr:terminase gpA endonuclease subunit [Burkholderiales bacterium]